MNFLANPIILGCCYHSISVSSSKKKITFLVRTQIQIISFKTNCLKGKFNMLGIHEELRCLGITDSSTLWA